MHFFDIVEFLTFQGELELLSREFSQTRMKLIKRSKNDFHTSFAVKKS